MTPTQTGDYDRALGRMLQTHELSGTQHAILNRMFWTLRTKASDRTQATIDLIASRTGACRESVMTAIRRGVALGLLVRIKTRVRRAIGAFVRVVNGTNVYVFTIPEPAEIVSESTEQTTILKVISDSKEGADDGGSSEGTGAGAEHDPRRPAADGVGGGVPDRPGKAGRGSALHQPKAERHPGEDSRQAGAWRWGRVLNPQPPMRTVAEQIAALGQPADIRRT